MRNPGHKETLSTPMFSDFYPTYWTKTGLSTQLSCSLGDPSVHAPTEVRVPANKCSEKTTVHRV